MPMQSTTDPVGEFNTLLGAAASMVRRLATGSGAGAITTSKQVDEVGTFQRLWNTTRDLVVDELDRMVQTNTTDQFFEPTQGSLTYRALRDGLAEDRRYGASTATALLLTLWARSGAWEGANGVPQRLLAIPTDPRHWPVVWAQNQAYWNSLFAAVAADDPLPPPPPAPEPGPLPEPAQPPPPAPPPAPEEEMTFDDDLVLGQNKGQKSNAPLIIGGAALLLVGGGVAYTLKKKGRRRR